MWWNKVTNTWTTETAESICEFSINVSSYCDIVFPWWYAMCLLYTGPQRASVLLLIYSQLSYHYNRLQYSFHDSWMLPDCIFCSLFFHMFGLGVVRKCHSPGQLWFESVIFRKATLLHPPPTNPNSHTLLYSPKFWYYYRVLILVAMTTTSIFRFCVAVTLICIIIEAKIEPKILHYTTDDNHKLLQDLILNDKMACVRN